MAHALLIDDPWLAGHLRRPAYRLANTWAVGAWADGSFASVCREGPVFVTAKIEMTDVEKIQTLETAGFRAVDAALTFECGSWRTVAAAGDARVRFAQPGDRADVMALAGRGFRFSRFHLDPNLPNTVADAIKGSWADNFFTGQRGDGMVVAELEGRVVGFTQLLWSADGALVIDLIAVAPEAGRRGLATAMIAFARDRGTGDARVPARLKVGTQAANIPSCRLYEGLGFRLCGAAMVLHHHGADTRYRIAA